MKKTKATRGIWTWLLGGGWAGGGGGGWAATRTDPRTSLRGRSSRKSLDL